MGKNTCHITSFMYSSVVMLLASRLSKPAVGNILYSTVSRLSSTTPTKNEGSEYSIYKTIVTTRSAVLLCRTADQTPSGRDMRYARNTDVTARVREYFSLLNTVESTGRLSRWETPKLSWERLYQYFENLVSNKIMESFSPVEYSQSALLVPYHVFQNSLTSISL